MSTGETPGPAEPPSASTRGHLKATERRIRAIEERLASGVASLRRHRGPRNVNQQMEESFSWLDRVALVVTQRVGTFGFFLIILAWTLSWLGWNTLAPASIRFDPAPAFVLWLFISNMIQILLMPLIMVGQNLLSRHSELRSENDFQINQKAEMEVEVIMLHLERLAILNERQQEMLHQILNRLEGQPPLPSGSAED